MTFSLTNTSAGQSSASFDPFRDLFICEEPALPFLSVLDLSPLVEFWRRAETTSWGPYFCGEISRQLDAAPELLEPIEDPSILERHADLLHALMTVSFPPGRWHADILAAMPPFQFQSFYHTPKFEQYLLSAEGMPNGRFNVDSTAMIFGKTLHAYLHVLEYEYGIKFELDYPLTLAVTDPDTGLDRFFRLDYNAEFARVRRIGERKTLSEEDLIELRSNLTDLRVWRRMIPPENYEFYGFTVLNAVDVTDQEVLSAVRRDLIENDTILSTSGFMSLQERIRVLLRRPDLELGVAAVESNEVLLLNQTSEMLSGCLYTDAYRYPINPDGDSIYDRCMREKRIMVVEDLSTYPKRTEVEDAILEEGMRSLIVAPLLRHDELIGLIHLWSREPGELNALTAMRFADMLPLFSMAINRTMEDLDNRVQAIIREEYTAIHPAVEWRFRRAALDHIRQVDSGQKPETAPIIFSDVYPLYSVSDIRGSSVERNRAIQADLIEHLDMVRGILRRAGALKPMPLIDHLIYQIGNLVDSIGIGLGSGDEASAIEFIRREIEPVLDGLRDVDPALLADIDAYRAKIDPHVGSIYHRRRDFEESVATINRAISSYLEEEQEKAQAIFPHYFEKHKSDGVDMGVYVGASIAPDRQWNMMYLRNLRLWQLMTLCGVARLSQRLKPSLKSPLDTAHLVLVQHAPLTIRFQNDEHRFDVDGAYNIRYEIMKKRIDKATIRVTGERLTQPGMVAVVFSQEREANEYREYINFLRNAGYLKGEVEELDLDEMQGVHGLRALRVAVADDDNEARTAIETEEIERVIRAISLA